MLKLSTLPLGLLALTVFFSIPKAAMAQCVVADVSIQAAIDGSDAPAEQVNDVAVDAEDGCVGNTSVHTNRQIHVGGTEPVQQIRRSNHQIRNGGDSQNRQTPTVVVPVEVQVDVDNPADRLQQRRR